MNKVLQNFMCMLRDSNATAAKISLKVMTELFRRNNWNDANDCQCYRNSRFSEVTQVLVATLTFSLGKDEQEKQDSN